jgi:hypothetical protein
MNRENQPSKAKPRPARRGFTSCAPHTKAAHSIYTTGTASAISCAPVFSALIDSAARCVSGLWRWLP